MIAGIIIHRQGSATEDARPREVRNEYLSDGVEAERPWPH